MDLGIKDKRALVTGSTAGIGFAAAAALAREGAQVIVNGRTQVRVSAAIEQLKQDVPGARVPIWQRRRAAAPSSPPVPTWTC
jgi:NAD(P)-dependent dehydrogenase (short-subunit alcohol dehydrogenase family)